MSAASWRYTGFAPTVVRVPPERRYEVSILRGEALTEVRLPASRTRAEIEVLLTKGYTLRHHLIEKV